MTLKPKEREAIVAYRLEKALSTLDEVKNVGSIGYWNLAANRLYYAAYYASVALLISRNIEASTHKGVHRMLGAIFVKGGQLTTTEVNLFGRLMNMRYTGDYEDLFDWEEDDILPLIPKVEQFILRIAELIKNQE